jgi:hypothetical protein
MIFVHLIFKFIIGFMGPTLGPTNSKVDLKLNCMEMYKLLDQNPIRIKIML